MILRIRRYNGSKLIVFASFISAGTLTVCKRKEFASYLEDNVRRPAHNRCLGTFHKISISKILLHESKYIERENTAFACHRTGQTNSNKTTI